MTARTYAKARQDSQGLPRSALGRKGSLSSPLSCRHEEPPVPGRLRKPEDHLQTKAIH